MGQTVGSDARRAGPQMEAASQADTIATDSRRRHVLLVAAAAIGALGVGLVAWPFLGSLRPSARTRSEGAPVSIDVSRLAPSEQVTVLWRGKPVWVLRRSAEMLELSEVRR